MQNITTTTPAQKLERARTRLNLALREVSATEGRLLDFETAEGLQRTLGATVRELEELTISISIMERKVR